MLLRNKKTKWEGEVDQEGWQVLVRAKLSKNYEILHKDELKKTSFELPEVTQFKGRKQKPVIEQDNNVDTKSPDELNS